MRARYVKGWVAGGLTALACALGTGQVSASSDFFPSKYFSLSEGNTYSLFQPYTDMAVPFLAPANSSHANILLLLTDAWGVRPHVLPRPTPFGRHGRYVAQTPIDMGTLNDVFDVVRSKPDAAPHDTSGVMDGLADRCRSNAASATAYVAALQSSDAPSSEKQILAGARMAVTTACTGGAKAAPFAPPKGAIASAAGHDFATYLVAASAFYSGDLVAARGNLTALATSAQPWIREAARYTTARLDLNAAEANINGQYGEIALGNVDKVALAAAETGFQTYLRDYPKGAYAVSARGLERRVLWLRGDKPRLADLYETLFDDRTAGGNVNLIDLTNEIDDKLLTGAQPADIRAPRLLAALDLMRMRTYAAPAALTRAELDAQAPRFATQPELYTYLKAAYSFYVEHRPADALTVLSGMKATRHMSTVQFSEQVLKGLSLEAMNQPAAARRQWLALIPVSEPVLQRSAVELALAQNYETGGILAAVFAKGSPIHDPTYREILLTRSASPELLRARAVAANAPVHERQLALYVLLYKELTRGRYKAFTDDWRLMPDPAPSRTAGDKLQIGLTNPPALVDFARFGARAHDDYTCPGIASVAQGLAANPHDEASLICIGEFLRLYEYDGYPYEGLDNQGFLRQDNPPPPPGAPPAPVQLGAVATQFPGVSISRLDIYKTIIKDRAAAADVRAYALYRAVNCWAPSSANHCDETDSPVSLHRQWFLELKARYPSTPWARKLKFYW